MTESGKKAAYALLSMQRHPWEQGFAAQAFLEAGCDEIWIPMARESIFRAAPDGRLALPNNSNVATDPASCGEACIRAWEKTNDVYFKDGAKNMLHFLLQEAPRSKDGFIFHMINRPQMWIDSAYMLPPFLYAMGNLREAYEQMEGFYRYLFDTSTGLFRHIYDFDDLSRNDNRLWATGNGWILMGLLRIKHPNTIELLNNMLRFIRSDGLFHDAINDENSFIDGTSALMTAYVIYSLVSSGNIPDKYIKYAEQAYVTCSANMDEYGIIHNVCGAPHFVSQGTSAEAQAAYILADSAREKLGL